MLERRHWGCKTTGTAILFLKFLREPQYIWRPDKKKKWLPNALSSISRPQGGSSLDTQGVATADWNHSVKQRSRLKSYRAITQIRNLSFVTSRRLGRNVTCFVGCPMPRSTRIGDRNTQYIWKVYVRFTSKPTRYTSTYRKGMICGKVW